MLEMEKLEELEEWARVGNASMPAVVKEDLVGLIESFPGLQRIAIYVLLDSFYWDLATLQQFVTVMQHVEQILKMPTILFLESLIPSNLHHIALQLFSQLTGAAVMDFVSSLQQPQGYELVDVAKYLSPRELQFMAEQLEALGAAAMSSMLAELKLSPTWCKHCELCRTKRIHHLEFRMVHGQVPPDTLPIPALLGQYEKPDLWAPADGRNYSFDASLGRIYWHKYPVELVHICDKCIGEVHESVSRIHCHAEVYHIEPVKRSQMIKQLHKDSDALAVIIEKISHTRALRRLKEFTTRALGAWQHGKSDEVRAQADKAKLAAQLKEKEDKRTARMRLIEGSLAVDQRWKTIDRQSDMKALSKRMNYALVQKHMGFDDRKPAPKLRKHAKSWRLKDFDDDGLPISEDAARKMFGHEVVEEVHDDRPELGMWRAIADEKANIYQQRRDKVKAEARAEEVRKFEQLKDYVRERIVILDRHQKQMERVAEQAEADRIAQRTAEKAMRRAQRFARYLEEERQRMGEEDRRSGEMRFLWYEGAREHQERLLMWEEETEQCESDRFWGLDYYENMMRREELRLRQFYEERVKFKNGQLVTMGSVQPTNTVNFTVFGTLPEDKIYENNQDRRVAVIRKLKAEEVRSKLRRVRIPFNYR